MVRRGVESEGAAMQADPLQPRPGQVEAGSIVGLWRYPVKSMIGEELNATEVTDRGLVGDRRFAVVDAATGKVAGAKNSRKWRTFFDFRAAYIEPPTRGSKLPAVRLTLPDGTVATSEQPDLASVLSSALGREVAFAEAEHDGEASGAQAEEYWPDMEGLEHRDTVTEWELPAGTFFDLAGVHLLTTATPQRLRPPPPESTSSLAGGDDGNRWQRASLRSAPTTGFPVVGSKRSILRAFAFLLQVAAAATPRTNRVGAPHTAPAQRSPQIANETARLSFASEPARQTLYKSKV